MKKAYEFLERSGCKNLIVSVENVPYYSSIMVRIYKVYPDGQTYMLLYTFVDEKNWWSDLWWFATALVRQVFDSIRDDMYMLTISEDISPTERMLQLIVRKTLLFTDVMTIHMKIPKHPETDFMQTPITLSYTALKTQSHITIRFGEIFDVLWSILCLTVNIDDV